MKQVVVIDTETEIGKSVAELLAVLANENSSISFLTEREIEEKEDAVLAELIKQGMETGRCEKNELMGFLDSSK